MGCVPVGQDSQRVTQKWELNCIQEQFTISIAPSSQSIQSNKSIKKSIKGRGMMRALMSDPRLLINVMQQPPKSQKAVEHKIKCKRGIQYTESHVVNSKIVSETSIVIEPMKKEQKRKQAKMEEEKEEHKSRLVSNIKHHPYIFQNEQEHQHEGTPHPAEIGKASKEQKQPVIAANVQQEIDKMRPIPRNNARKRQIMNQVSLPVNLQKEMSGKEKKYQQRRQNVLLNC